MTSSPTRPGVTTIRGFSDAHGGPLRTIGLCLALALIGGVSWAQTPISATPEQWSALHAAVAAAMGALMAANLPLLAYISAAGIMPWPPRLIGAVLAPAVLAEITRRFWLSSPWPAIGVVAAALLMLVTIVDFARIRTRLRVAGLDRRRARRCGCPGSRLGRRPSRGCECEQESP